MAQVPERPCKLKVRAAANTQLPSYISFKGYTRTTTRYTLALQCMYVWMYVCMYVFVFVCVFVCVYACMHACMYACMYVRMYVCTQCNAMQCNAM